MPSVDSLPGDQRAVLQLVLSRGRSYDQIARLLSINPGSVRERALAALDALGPETRVSAENRGLIADYLLGQLPEAAELDHVRDLLAHSASERAWARVVSSELAPLAGESLPEIPTETTGRRRAEAAGPTVSPAAAPPPADSDEGRAEGPAAVPADIPGSLAPTEPAATAEAVRQRAQQRSRGRERRGGGDEYDDDAGGGPRSSRLGGVVVIALAVVVVAVVLFFVLRGGSNSPHHPTASKPTSSTAASASSSSTTSGASSSTTAKVIAQINLTPPSGSGKAAGIAEVLKEGSSDGIAIVAQNVAPNTTKPPNAYAVWLYNSPADAKILGFVNPGVGSNGRLSTAGPLPSNASRYKDLIVTLETTGKPTKPGTIILKGALTGL